MYVKTSTYTYNGPGKTYDRVNKLKEGKKVSITGIEKDGYTLLSTNTNDEWVKTKTLWTKAEKEKAEEEERKAAEEAKRLEEEAKKAAEEAEAELEAKKSTSSSGSAKVTKLDESQSDALLAIDNPDSNYNGAVVTLTADDRDLLERLVMGEAGDQGYIGAALVAQAIRDTIVYKGYSSVASVRTGNGYSGSISRQPNDDVKKACAFIFDQGGYAVKHEVYYFYAPAMCSSSFHESRPFVVQYKGHRFFS